MASIRMLGGVAFYSWGDSAMSIKACYSNGVFTPLEEVRDALPGKVYRVFSEEELRDLTEEFAWLRAAESSFAFWDNEEDTAYHEL